MQIKHFVQGNPHPQHNSLINQQLIKSNSSGKLVPQSPPGQPQHLITFQPIEMTNRPGPQYQQIIQNSRPPENVVRMEQINRSGSSSRLLNQQSAIQYLKISEAESPRTHNLKANHKPLSVQHTQGIPVSPPASPRYHGPNPIPATGRPISNISSQSGSRPTSVLTRQSNIINQSKSVQRPPSNRVIFTHNQEPSRPQILNSGNKPMSPARSSRSPPPKVIVQPMHQQSPPPKVISHQQSRRIEESQQRDTGVRHSNKSIEHNYSRKEQVSYNREEHSHQGSDNVRNSSSPSKNQNALKVYSSYEEYLRQKQALEGSAESSLEVTDNRRNGYSGGSYMKSDHVEEEHKVSHQSSYISHSNTQSHHQTNSYLSSNRNQSSLESQPQRSREPSYSRSHQSNSSEKFESEHSQNRSRRNSRGSDFRQEEPYYQSQNTTTLQNDDTIITPIDRIPTVSPSPPRKQEKQQQNRNAFIQNSSASRQFFQKQNTLPRVEQVSKSASNQFSVIREQTLEFSDSNDRDRISSIKSNGSGGTNQNFLTSQATYGQVDQSNMSPIQHPKHNQKKVERQKKIERYSDEKRLLESGQGPTSSIMMKKMSGQSTVTVNPHSTSSYNFIQNRQSTALKGGLVSKNNPPMIQSQKAIHAHYMMGSQDNEEDEDFLTEDYRSVVQKIYMRELEEGLRRIHEVYSRTVYQHD